MVPSTSHVVPGMDEPGSLVTSASSRLKSGLLSPAPPENPRSPHPTRHISRQIRNTPKRGFWQYRTPAQRRRDAPKRPAKQALAASTTSTDPFSSLATASIQLWRLYLKHSFHRRQASAPRHRDIIGRPTTQPSTARTTSAAPFSPLATASV